MAQSDTLSFVIVGHVDHGKSTLIGRLLYDTDSLPPDKIEEVRRVSAELGRQTEFAYLLDHLAEERKQGITIDTTQVFFKTARRHYVIIDAPGHVEFVKNMITGASQAEAAVLIIDAAEGVREQTRRHSYMLSMLGLKQVIVVLNKMDLVDYSQQHFGEVRRQAGKWLDSIGIEPMLYIPIAAINGDNIAQESEKMGWFEGPCFLKSLDTLKNRQLPEEKPLIFPVQDVYKIDDKRINVGRVESGGIAAGDSIKILPDGQVTKVKTVEKFLEDVKIASAGECIGITTEDSVFLDRGNIICTAGAEPKVTERINANVFWMDKKDYDGSRKLTLRCATQETGCKIEQIKKRIDSSTLQVIEQDAATVKNLEVAQVVIKCKKPIAVKDFNDVQELGRFVIVQDENICAGGIITSAED